jgi:hypothetical protein
MCKRWTAQWGQRKQKKVLFCEKFDEMKKILTFALLTATLSLFGQNDNVWTSFWNTDTTLIGYKDKNGAIKIEPRFESFSPARKFEKIIAVVENVEGKWSSYYLTKAGNIVGKDSLYFFDNTPDCESEGFIRFRDRKTDKAGMFDRNGNIVVPTEYNDLTRVRNGMIMAIKGAEREYLDNYREHWKWVGGQEMLIDTLNNILIDNFTYDNYYLNFFSIEKTQNPHFDTRRNSFLAKDGNYYSFIDFEKDFEQWLTNNLFSNLTAETLINASYDTIICSSAKKHWTKSNRQQFVNDNFEVLKSGLLEILKPNCNYSILINGLNSYMYEGVEFEKYFNGCGEGKEWIYPVMELYISYKNKKNFTQNCYHFLRTDNGYKLISATIRNGKIKY